jgi:hypothetical protein
MWDSRQLFAVGFWHPVGHPADYRSAGARANQDQLPKICIREHVDDIVHVRLHADTRVRQMGALTQTGERRCVHAVPVVLKQGNQLSPAPAPKPGRMHENKDCHSAPLTGVLYPLLLGATRRPGHRC